MATQPSNEVLSNKLDNLTEKLDIGLDHLTNKIGRVEEHVAKTNGHVADNTKFRLEKEKVLEEHLKEYKQGKDDKLKRYSDLAWKIGVAVAAMSFGVSKFF